MKHQNKIKTTLFMGILIMAMTAGGCQSQGSGTEDTTVATRSPTRSELIKEGKIKPKKKNNTEEETKETAPPETAQPEEADTTTTDPDTYDTNPQQQNIAHYILNTNTKLFHDPSCEKVSYIAPHNHSVFDGTRDELIGQGYEACYTCDTTTTVPDTYDTNPQQQNIAHYILNTNTKLFHDPSCEKVSYIAPHNHSVFDGTRDELIGQGYEACYTCDP